MPNVERRTPDDARRTSNFVAFSPGPFWRARRHRARNPVSAPCAAPSRPRHRWLGQREACEGFSTSSSDRSPSRCHRRGGIAPAPRFCADRELRPYRLRRPISIQGLIKRPSPRASAHRAVVGFAARYRASRSRGCCTPVYVWWGLECRAGRAASGAATSALGPRYHAAAPNSRSSGRPQPPAAADRTGGTTAPQLRCLAQQPMARRACGGRTGSRRRGLMAVGSGAGSRFSPKLVSQAERSGALAPTPIAVSGPRARRRHKVSATRAKSTSLRQWEHRSWALRTDASWRNARGGPRTYGIASGGVPVPNLHADGWSGCVC